VDTTEALDHDLGLVYAPLLIRSVGPGLVAGRLSLGLEELIAPHRQPVLLHKPVHSVLADGQLINEAQVSKYTPVAPDRVISLE